MFCNVYTKCRVSDSGSEFCEQKFAIFVAVILNGFQQKGTGNTQCLVFAYVYCIYTTQLDDECLMIFVDKHKTICLW